MPRVKIDTPGVTVELDAGEASVEQLGKQALEMFKEASDHIGKERTQVGFGLSNEKRWTPDHHDTHYNGSRGFAPAKAEHP
jgi:hypothetical protein